MKTSKVTAAHLARSVIAAPPIARGGNLELNGPEVRKLLRHIEGGGVQSLLFGSNANLQNLPHSEYGQLLELLEEHADSDTWVIPGAGPDYGRLMDQAPLLREHRFPMVLALPAVSVFTSEGVETGLRRFAEAADAPVMLAIDREDYLRFDQLTRLHEDGVIGCILYAIARDSSADDPYLSDLVEAVPANRIISGHGDAAAAVHLRQFGLRGFSSGGACIAPTLAGALLSALKEQDDTRAAELAAQLRPLEALRRDLGPARVLHDAVTSAGLAALGPPLPLLSSLNADQHRKVAGCAQALLEAEQALRS